MTEKLIAETFAKHQPAIGQWARQSSDNFADVFRFVLATIQQPLSMTPDIVKDYKENGAASIYAFGMKRDALHWLEDNSGLLYDNAMFLWNYGRRPLLSYFASLPGLGLIKGGFLAQLAFGSIGCLDRHNIERFGLDVSEFAAYRFKRAKRTETRQRILFHYIDLCDKCGGSALLWAEWCEYVAQRDNDFETAEDVSRFHLTALGLNSWS